MLENYKNVLDSTIYECNLKVVRADSIAFADKSKKENISEMETYDQIKVMVQRTMSKNWVREIITGTLIPVNYIITYRDNYDGCYCDDRYLFKESPAYILLKYDKCGPLRLNSPFSLITAEDNKVLEYIKSHSNKDEYAKLLQNIFNIAEQNYQTAIRNTGMSDKAKVKQLLKKI